METNICRRLLILICSFLLMVTIFIFSLLMLPIYIYRLLISYLTIMRPDLDSIVEIRNVIFIPFNFWKEPKLAIFMKCGIQGTMSVEKLKEMYQNKIVTDKKSKIKPKYSRLQQYPYKWLGYYFWKWEENFSIDDHVHGYSCEKLQKDPDYRFSVNEIKEIESSLIEKPFPKNKSMWEITLVPNVEENQTLLYIRFNHAIADGYSVTKLLLDILLDESFMDEIESLEKANRISWKTKFLIVTKTMVQGFYDLTDTLLQKGLRNIWKNVHHNETEKALYSESKQISMDIVKEACFVHGIGVSAVIYSAFTSALRKALLNNRGNVPKTVYTSLLMPLCNHPDRLTNHVTGTTISCPMGESNVLRRAKEVQSVIEKAKNSTVPFIQHGISATLFALFPFVTESVCANAPFPVGATSFRGFKKKLGGENFEINSVNFSVTLGFITHRRPIFLSTCTYNNKLQFWIAGHNSIFTQDDMDAFVRTMENDIQNLKYYTEKSDDKLRISVSTL